MVIISPLPFVQFNQLSNTEKYTDLAYVLHFSENTSNIRIFLEFLN